MGLIPALVPTNRECAKTGMMRVNKPEAARRQADAAIRLLFGGEDVLACATLAGAANKIVRDLAESGGKSPSLTSLKAIIRPGMEKEFWQVWNSVPNFLKHADQDPAAIIEFEDEWVDLSLFHTVIIYRELGFAVTPEMIALWSIVIAHYPTFMNFPNDTPAKRTLESLHVDVSRLNRAQRLDLASRYLDLLKRGA